MGEENLKHGINRFVEFWDDKLLFCPVFIIWGLIILFSQLFDLNLSVFGLVIIWSVVGIEIVSMLRRHNLILEEVSSD